MLNRTPLEPAKTAITADTAHKEQRALLIQSKQATEGFIEVLRTLPISKGRYIFAHDLYALFSEFAQFELPDGFHIEFGRLVSNACRESRLHFRKNKRTRASLAVYEGIDLLHVREAVAGRLYIAV